MATYGYSTPYTGARIQPLPPGYMEAATAPGRNIAAGIAAAGQNIGEGIKRYLQNREEENYLNAKIDAGLTQYMDAGRQGPLPSGATADMANLMNVIGEKNADKLASGKANKAEKLAIAHALETYGQKELQALQINEAKRKVQEREQLGLLQRYALGLPETRQVDVNLGDIQVQPEGPPQLIPDKQLEDIRSQLQPLVEQYYRQDAPGLGQAVPITGDGPQPLASQIDQLAERRRQNIQQLAERGRQRIQQLGGQEGRLLYPEQVNVPVQGKMDEQIPYAETRRQLAQFAAAQNMSPEAFQSIDKILEIAGRTRPTRVEQVGNMGSVVRFGDKEQFVPAPKADIGDMLKVRGLTIDFPEFRGTAPTEKEAADFRDQYSNVLSSRRSIQRLLEIAQMGKVTQQTPEIKAEAEQLARAAQGALRLDIIGPGTVTDSDRKLLEDIVRNPTDIFSLKSSNVKSLELLLERAGSGIESKAKSIGLEVLKPDQQSVQTRRSTSGTVYQIKKY